MVVIGSYALMKHNFPFRREPKDVDIATTGTEFLENPSPTLKVDKIIFPPELLDMIPTREGYATPDAIYTLKCSHFGWDIKWDKTKADILYLKAKGCKLIPELYHNLKSYWQITNKDLRAGLSLNQGKEEFFTDNVNYVVDHDWLHELVAYPNEPLYTRVLKDGKEVLTDRAKFDKLNKEDQIRLFREEITVIAIERWLINPYYRGNVSWYAAYKLALKKTILTLTKGWATDFILLNLEDFVKPDFSYFKYPIEVLEEKYMTKDYVDGHALINEMVVEYLKCMGPEDYTPEEVEEVQEDFLDNVIGNDWWAQKEREKAFQERGYKYICQEGGGEGGAEACFTVFQWKDKLYKIEYSYYSHHGFDFDDCLERISEVTPVEKTVVVYE